jgi:hypothetical protein
MKRTALGQTQLQSTQPYIQDEYQRPSTRVCQMTLEALGLISRVSMTRFHYLYLSKLGRVKLKISDYKAKTVTISFDVETCLNFAADLSMKPLTPMVSTLLIFLSARYI